MPDSYTLDFDYDQLKHFVRLEHWLPTANSIAQHVGGEIKAGVRKSGPKYFTLCAAKAVDVFMFEMNRVISRDKTRRRIANCWFCTNEEFELGGIKSLFGGSEDSGFLAPLQELFNYVPSPAARPYLKDPSLADRRRPSADVRKEIRFALDQYQRFVGIFPLDLINFDLCGTLVPPPPSKPEVWRDSLNQVFEWQQNQDRTDGHRCTKFGLLLTASLNRTDIDTAKTQELIAELRRNANRFPAFRDSVQGRFPDIEAFNDVASDQFEELMGLAIPKSFLIRGGLARGWRSTDRKIALYWRQSAAGNYAMLAVSVVFGRVNARQRRRPKTVEEELLAWSGTNLVKPPKARRIDKVVGPRRRHYYRFLDSKLARRIEEHLAGIRQFREQLRRELDFAPANPI